MIGGGFRGRGGFGGGGGGGRGGGIRGGRGGAGKFDGQKRKLDKDEDDEEENTENVPVTMSEAAPADKKRKIKEESDDDDEVDAGRDEEMEEEGKENEPTTAEHIRVYARVRPSKESLIQKVVQIDNRGLSVNLNNEIKSFQFDGIYGEDAKQDEVFDGAASRIVHGTLRGYNGTVFAYGQTGSGKTHTMIGPNNKKFDENAGIIPRGLHLLFEELIKKAEEMPGKFSSKITVSFVEIYNENIYDLFVMNNEKLKIGQDQDGNAIVKGASEVFVKDLNDAMQIHTEESHGTISTARSAFLNLVDLAGSERVSQSKVEGDRLKETAQINKSLHNLTLVIRELSEKKKNGFVPFRNSVLTHILKDSLGGNARTAVMINVHPDKCYYSETLSTLNFSAEIMVNEDLKGDSVLAYQAEIRRLKEELEKMQNMNAEEMAETKRSLEAWKEAAAKYERQLSVARRNAVNAAIVARKDGHAASMAESIWDKSMAEVAESVRNVPTSGIRSVQLKELTEQLNLCVFEKDELQSQLDDERKAKAELQEKYNRMYEGAMSPRRPQFNSTSSLDESVSSMGGPLEATFSLPSESKKDLRRTRDTPAKNRQGAFFRPVLDVQEKEGGGGGQTRVDLQEPDNTEERREMEMEMQLNTQKQIIDEKTQEAESLSRLLKDAEKRISEAEEQLSNAVQSMEEEQKKAEILKKEIDEAAKMIVMEKEKVIELEKREMDLEEELAEAKDEMVRLQSDTDLLKSTHEDELCELEKRLTNNLSDKVKKEIEMKLEIDRLIEEMSSVKNQLLNKETEKNATEEILTMVKDRMLEAEEEKNEKMKELELLNAQMDEMRRGMEKMEEEREKSRKENEKKIGALEKELDEKKKEIEGEKKKMEEMGESSSSQLNGLRQELSSLRITKDTELAEKDKDIEHWKTVSHQFLEKMNEMKAEFNSEKEKHREVDERERRMHEIIALSSKENDELKQNLASLGSHANTKQKQHLLGRYVGEKRELTARVSQLEALLTRHGINLPQREKDEGKGGDEASEGGRRDTFGSTENIVAGPSSRMVPRPASSTAAASAASNKTSVRSTTTRRK